MKLAEKFDHPFSYLIIFGNIFALGHGFDFVMVTGEGDDFSLFKCVSPFFLFN